MEIKGKGFKLRNWQRDDVTELQRLADNPKIAANLYDRFPSPYTLDDAAFFIDLKIDEEPATSFVIDIAGRFAGTIGIELRGDVFIRSPVIGYWLGEEFWDRGIMSEATGLMTKYVFENFDINCLQTGVFSWNPASMRVLEKAGYIKQGILKGVIYKNGEILDEHVYTIYRT